MKKIVFIILAAMILVTGCSPKELVPFTLDPGEYFVTNIKGSDSYLKTDIMLLAADDTYKKEFEEDTSEIRDTIIYILRSMTIDELKAEDIQEKLSLAITTALNEKLEHELFLKIYFNEFVIQ